MFGFSPFLTLTGPASCNIFAISLITMVFLIRDNFLSNVIRSDEQ